MKKVTTYILVWEDEREKWHYFIDEFNEGDFPYGYTDYYIIVKNGVIVEDTWKNENKNSVFEDKYNVDLWNN